MTAPDIVLVDEEDETYQPRPVEDPKNIFEEFEDMLKEVCDAQRVVREGTDDLAEIRRLVHKTKVNIVSHISTVD